MAFISAMEPVNAALSSLAIQSGLLFLFTKKRYVHWYRMSRLSGWNLFRAHKEWVHFQDINCTKFTLYFCGSKHEWILHKDASSTLVFLQYDNWIYPVSFDNALLSFPTVRSSRVQNESSASVGLCTVAAAAEDSQVSAFIWNSFAR